MKMIDTQNLATAIQVALSGATERQRADIELLYEKNEGFDITLDNRSAPAAETLRSAQVIGTKIKTHLGLDEKYGMNVVGQCDYKKLKWRMNSRFRKALDYLNGNEFNENNEDVSQTFEVAFQNKVAKAILEDQKSRLIRIASAVRIPERVEVSTFAFRRNPDIVAETLFRSAGICEDCKKPAPFFRKTDGLPYLEVHHKQPLAQGGEDTLENTIAVCPNCHRKAHFG
ncbi:HNH endonuclease [Undibacterium sp. Xuan67W]|uniref:HNH endonuclease n=1 Tax=Undibacterium sp. Xuan67W TaxID=3413057 RepID=UPI003BF028E8